MIKALRQFISHPWVGLFASLAMLLAGLSEGWDTIQEDVMNADIKTHHGVIIYGFYAVLKSVPDVFDGLDTLLEKVE